MTEGKGINAPERLEGHFKAMTICWLLGLGSLVAWNSVLTIGDYYGVLFPGPEQNALGNVLAFCLMCGIFAGVLLDWLWIIGNGKF